MNVQFVGSPNYWAGRTQKVSKLLQHWIVGNLASADAMFSNPAKQVSAHYGVEDETIHQYVRDEDTAWHARQANPFSIGIEHSAGPGRPASDKTYAASIELNAILCKKFNLNPDDAIEYHKKYVATSCSELDLDRIKKGVKTLLAGGKVPTSPTPIPTPPSNNTSGSLRLPASATSWRVYKPDGPYTVGGEVGKLNPSLFGGLTYEILGNPTANVYLIQTRDFGKVAIYAGAETGAQVAATGQGITKGSGGGKTVYLPAVPTWRVYPINKAPTIGNEIGYLAPANYGGLAYAVLAEPQANVVTIQTQTFGRVNIYVGSETGAIIK